MIQNHSSDSECREFCRYFEFGNRTAAWLLYGSDNSFFIPFWCSYGTSININPVVVIMMFHKTIHWRSPSLNPMSNFPVTHSFHVQCKNLPLFNFGKLCNFRHTGNVIWIVENTSESNIFRNNLERNESVLIAL